jgi:hypothetical protein
MAIAFGAHEHMSLYEMFHAMFLKVLEWICPGRLLNRISFRSKRVVIGTTNLKSDIAFGQ